MKNQIKVSDLDVGMLLSIDGKLEKVANIKKIDPPAGGWIEEEVPVEQIQPGDEILSLNERTGYFEWHTVEAALFKGIQDLYELITSQGKRIRTTKEHPYFVKIMGHSNQDLRGSPQYQSVRGKPLIDGEWLKVQSIKPGMFIATIDGWEEIASVSKVKRGRTYDLQIEGTHNFLGNDIVAHNTYLTGGNVGIGWTSPSQLFQINPTYVGTQLTNPLPFVVTSQGNVGVGTTAPRSALDILGGSLLQTPQNPTFVGGLTLNNAPHPVFVSGKYAYVGDSGGFKVIDVSNPAAPTTITVGSINPTAVLAVFVSGRYAYIGRTGSAAACASTSTNFNNCELQIIDISDPARPRVVGGADDGAEGINAVFVSGRYAYVGKDLNTSTCNSTTPGGCEFQIYDISNPTNPVFVGGADNGDNDIGNNSIDRPIFVSGRYAYIGKDSNAGTCSSTTNTGCEFQIYDISNPTNPVFVGGADISINYGSIFVSGRYAYAARSGNASMQIYDISNPYSPTQISSLSFAAIARSIYVSGKYLYIGSSLDTGTCSSTDSTGCEFKIYDISNPALPLFIGGASTLNYIQSIFISGRYAYAGVALNSGSCTTTNDGCEFQIYDISGIDVTSAQIGSLEAGALQVRESAIISNQLSVGGGLGVGPGGILSQGMVGIGVSSGTVGLRVEMLGIGTGYTAPAAIFNGGNVGINLGIGSSTPGATLVVGGNVGIGWTGYTFASMPGLGLSVFGNVGIGTTSPTYGLQVIGNIGIGQSLTVGSALQLQIYNCGDGMLTTDSSGRVICDADAGGSGIEAAGSPEAGQVTFFDGGGTQVQGATPFYWNNELMRLGIGSSASANTLGVFGSLGIGSSFAYYNAPANGLIVEGNVGLGTSSPIAPLHVWGNGTVSGIFLNGNIGIGWTSPSQLFQINPTYVGTQLTNPLPFTVTSQGNVGVGTTAPRSALDILGGSLLQTPQNLTWVGGTNGTSNNITAGQNNNSGQNEVFVSGRYLYILNSTGLIILDISNPSTPTQIGSATIGSSLVGGVYVVGNYAYVGTGLNLRVYDISNPTAPALVGQVSVSGSIRGLQISGRYLYITTVTAHAFQIYDISNPINPTRVSTVSLNVNAVGLFVSGKYAYVGKANGAGTCNSTDNTSCEFMIYDISNPASPLYLGGASMSAISQSGDIYVSGRYAYTNAGNTGQFKIFDISNPASPTLMSTNAFGTSSAFAFSFAVSGNYLFVGGNKLGLPNPTCNSITNSGCTIQLWDISNPANPIFLGGKDTGVANLGGSTAIVVSGRYLYTLQFNNVKTCTSDTNFCGINVFDISGIDVTSAQIGSLEAGGLQVRENAFINNQLYVGGGIGLGPGGLLSQGMVGIGVSSGTPGLVVNMLGVGTGYTAPSAIFNGGNVGINLGIGSSTPGSTLFVGGNVGIGWTGFTFASMPGLGLSVFGNVGIGTTTPTYGLQVVGNVGIGQSLTVGSALQLSGYACNGLGGGGKLTTDSSGRVVCQDDSGADTLSGSAASGQVTFFDGGSSVTGANTLFWNNELMRLGVGSSASANRLGVFGSMGIGTSFSSFQTPASNSLVIEGNVGLGTSSPIAPFHLWGAGFASNETPGAVFLNGNVGIGWTSPSQLFQINPTYVGTQLTNPLPFTVTSQGNVGVGTTAPRSALDILGGSLLQTPQNPTFIGGSDLQATDSQVVTSIFVSGKYAYVGTEFETGSCTAGSNTGCEFMIFDVSNPNNPTFINGFEIANLVESIYVSGKFAYLGKTGNAGTCSSTTNTGCELQVYDVSNPNNPLYIGGADDGGDAGQSVFVSGRYAYLGKAANGGTCSSTTNTGCELQIYDVSNPTSPVYTGGINTGNAIASVFTLGRYTYAGDGTTLKIFDVTNPTNPIQISSTSTSGTANSVYVSGRYAYIGDSGGTLRIFDTSNPYSPSQVATASAGDGINSVFVSGRYLYLGKTVNTGTCNFFTSTGCELQVYDVSNPYNPLYVGGANVTDAGSSAANTVFVSGRYAYVGDGVASSSPNCSSKKTDCEFQIYDIGGIDVTSALIGSLEAGGLQVRESAVISNQLTVNSGINIGPGGLLSQGMVGIGVSSGTPGLVVNMLGVGTGYTAPAAIFNGGNVGINLGIGASTPGSTLFVGGNVGIGWTGYTFAAMPSLGLSVFGNVGIGTTTPTYGLHVVGNVGIGQSLTVGSALQLQIYNCGDGMLTTDSSGRVVCDADAGGSGIEAFGTPEAGQVTFFNGGGTQVQGADPFFWDNANMRLGIGSSASANRLGVFGSMGIGSSFAYYNAPANGLIVEGNVGLGTSSPIAPFHLWGAGFGSNDIPGAVFLNGNIGIGWTSPSQLFQINPTYVGTNLTNPLPFTVTSQGNVGVGTTAPRSALDILGGSLLQTPQNPMYIGGASFTSTNNGTAIFISGKYAYVGKNNSTGNACTLSTLTNCLLLIYDISNPNSPVAIAGISGTPGFTGSAASIYVSGNYLYLGRGVNNGACSSTTRDGCEFQIWDISNPSKPLYTGGLNLTFPGGTAALFVSGRYAYIANSSNILEIADVSDPTSPLLVSQISLSAFPISIFVSGRYVYVGGGSASSYLDIYDVSNPIKPIRVSSVAPGGTNRIESVFVSGSYAYLGDSGGTYYVYRISNPYSPTQVSTASVVNAIRSVFVSGKYLYLSNAANPGLCSFSASIGCEIQVYDVSNPSNPIFVGGADNGGNAPAGNVDKTIFVSGRYLYATKVSNANTCDAQTNVGCEFQIYDIGGIDVTSAQIGSLEAGALQVRESAIISNQLTVGGGLGIGPGGLYSQGMVGIGVSSGTPGLVVNMIGVGAGYTAPAAIFNGGNVGINLGIGTSTPGSTLFVGGNVGIGWTGNTFSSIPGLGLSVFGNVGIGRTSANYGVDVAGNAGIGVSLTVGSALRLQSYNCSGLSGGGKLTTDSAGRVVCEADAGAGLTGTGTAPQIAVWDGTSSITGYSTFEYDSTNLVLEIGDNVNTTPNGLDVDGELAIGCVDACNIASEGRIWVQSNGTTFRFNSDATTADYSEYIKQEDASEPGDVMILTPGTPGVGFDSPGVVRRSNSSYDENIIGVITTRGTSYNNPDDNRDSDPTYANVGMLGQVWVKVNLENGPIYTGDPLTSSSTTGEAMKATKTGRIIGRAMEDYLATPGVGSDSPGVSSTGAPPGQILMQVNVTWWEAEQFIERLDSGLLYLDGNLAIGATPYGASFDSPGVSLSVGGSVLSTSNILSLGNVGVGTTNPLYGLTIEKEASSSAAASIVNLSGVDTPDTSGLRIGLGTAVSGVSSNFIDFYAGVASDSAGVRVGRIRLNDNKVAYESTGADFAEYFDALEETEDGDLVSLATPGAGLDSPGVSHSGVAKSSIPYDQNLIGVVSKDAAFVGNADYTPGVGLDSPGVNKAIVGLLGQIKTKVSTINGDIKRGDYLTSSEIPGVAAKATRPGQVIGQALEDFSANTGSTPGVENCAYTPGVECGQILVHVKSGFADPGNFFSSLTMDNEGNLIIPKLKVASLTIDSRGIEDSNLKIEDSRLITDSSSPSSTLDPQNTTIYSPSSTVQFYDLSGKIATLESRIKNLELRIKEENTEATPSAEIAGISSEASDSAELALYDTLIHRSTDALDLTPPDILLASDSATLTADLKVTSSAQILGSLTAYDAIIQNSLKSFGTTTLGNTLIAGNLTIDGTLSFSENTIDALSTLYLQKSQLASSIDIFNGKITLEKDGTIKAKTIIVDQIKVKQDQTAGVGIIPAGQIQASIKNPHIDETSVILLTPKVPLGQLITVTNKSDGSFTVKLSKSETKDVEFDYLIVSGNPTVGIGPPSP